MSASAAAAAGASMSIMDKYQSLNRGIDDARRETAALQDETEEYQMQLVALRDQCGTMEQDEIGTAQHESTALQQDIQQLRATAAAAAAAASRGVAGTNDPDDTSTAFDHSFQKRRVAFLKDYIAQQRRDFCEESRDFRLTMKRLKLSTESSSSFLDTAVSHAFLQVNGVDVVVEDQHHDAALEEDENEPTALSVEVLEDEWHEEAMATTTSNNAARYTAGTTNSSADADLLISTTTTTDEAATAYQHAFLTRRTTEKDFNDAMVAYTEATERAIKRQHKLDTMQGTLDRIRTNISSLTHELTETHDHTTELQAMSESFQQRAVGMQQRQAQQQQQQQQARGGGGGRDNNRRAAATSNPSTSRQHQQQQSSQQPPPPTTNNNRNNRTIFTNNPYANNTTNNNRTAVERQHPHLAGRIRMDRQFGGASIGGMHVIGGAEVVMTGTGGIDDDDDSDDDDISDFVAFGRRR